MNIKRLLYTVGIVLVSIIIMGIAAYGYISRMTNEPGGHSSDFLLYIQPGDNLTTLAEFAKISGVVEEPWQLKVVAYIHGMQNKIYVGEYEIEKGLSVLAVLKKIAAQQTYKRRIVIPEGSSVKQVTEILSKSFGVDMTDYSPPHEGTLLPETYFYERGVDATTLVNRMQNAMQTTLEMLWRSRAPDLPFETKTEAITLASIVEKETGLPGERKDVAAVFINRLRENMRLQSDPTVIYGITEGLPLGRPITRTDLRNDTPYNSYRRNGLPPTAIANPGRASIEAVLNPSNVPFLYFVANGTGGHAFAVTLEEHNENVARWREIERNQ